MSPIVGAIEAGGTKFVCALARANGEILLRARIPTTTPEVTLPAVIEFFHGAAATYGTPAAFGIGAFGPVDVRTRSPTFGQILPTPKKGWAGTDLIGPLRTRFARPVALDTDVNAAARAELAALQERISVDPELRGRGLPQSLVYVTVGTGIGGGVMCDGHAVHGLMHPEMGHIMVRRDPRDADFAGVCPFHGDCLEGLASGPAVQARWGRPFDQLEESLAASAIIGGYLGQLAANIALMLASERIVFGGGVMTNSQVLPHIRRVARAQLAGYLPVAAVHDSLEGYITPPLLGDDAGLIGAIQLALSQL